MKIKRGKHKLTFLVIREANRKVIRFRLSAFLLYAVPMLFLTVVCIALLLHAENLKVKLEKQELATELKLRSAAYKQVIDLKNLTIAHLQDEIIDLATRSDEVRHKVELLEQLEREIREVAEGEMTSEELERLAVGESDKDMRPVSISSYREENGVGGIEQLIDTEDAEEVASFARDDLSALDRQISALLDDLSMAREDLIAYLHNQRTTPTYWPTDSTRITSHYGYRRDPFTRRSAFHGGIDIGGKSGDPIYAAADGIVTSAGYSRGHGYNVTIKHPSGIITRYAHLRKYEVEKGQKVLQGERIGQLGSTGRSTGPHLHFEVIEDGKNVDPLTYLDNE